MSDVLAFWFGLAGLLAAIAGQVLGTMTDPVIWIVVALTVVATGRRTLLVQTVAAALVAAVVYAIAMTALGRGAAALAYLPATALTAAIEGLLLAWLWRQRGKMPLLGAPEKPGSGH
jgi:hypothetical protein